MDAEPRAAKGEGIRCFAPVVARRSMKGAAFCKECGAPAPQVQRTGGAAGLESGLDATQVRPAASSEPPGSRSVPPPPHKLRATSIAAPSGYTPGWQAPPPRRRTGLIVGIVVAAVIVLAGAGAGRLLRPARQRFWQDGLLVDDCRPASPPLALWPQVSTTVTIPSTSSSDTESTTTSSLPSTTTSSLPSTTTTTLAPAPEPRLHTPASGSAERKAILDVLRVPVEKELNQSVLFVIDTFKVENDFAFVLGQTVQPSGAPIDYSKTPYLQDVQAGAFSDEAMGLLHWNGGLEGAHLQRRRHRRRLAGLGAAIWRSPGDLSPLGN